MSETKYVASGGLAFSEEKDMEKLRRYSLKGWHVSGFKFMGYILEKEESADYIYSVDYQSLEDGGEEEYFDFFSSAGWSHVASVGYTHLFRALPGTKPLYTDRNTTVEKYNNSGRLLKGFTALLVLIAALAWTGAILSTGTLKSIFLVSAVILGVIAIPAAGTLIVTYKNKWKAEGRKGLVNLIKVIPFLLLLLAIIFLLVVNGGNTAVSTLAAMIIGAIALPTVIWSGMSLYYRFRKQ